MTTKEKIIITFFKNLYSNDIRAKFFAWYHNSSGTEEKENVLKSLWDELDAKPDASTLVSLNQVQTKLGFHKQTSGSRMKRLRIIGRIAAIFMLPLISAFITYLLVQQPLSQPEPLVLAECFVPYGEIKTIVLPDSTKVTINSGSILIYPENSTAQDRYVYLNGEAYFDVTRQEDRPFRVKVDGYDVEVLGTKFNVSAYSDDAEISTTLESGTVRLNFKDEHLKPVVLKPNQKIAYDKQTHSLTGYTVKDENIAVWKKGHFIFQRASIYDILRTFERRYGINIYLNSNRFDDDIITVKFIHDETLEESFRILKQITPGLKYEINGNKVYVY